jgi:hypothetical protein
VVHTNVELIGIETVGGLRCEVVIDGAWCTGVGKREKVDEGSRLWRDAV